MDDRNLAKQPNALLAKDTSAEETQPGHKRSQSQNTHGENGDLGEKQRLKGQRYKGEKPVTSKSDSIRSLKQLRSDGKLEHLELGIQKSNPPVVGVGLDTLQRSEDEDDINKSS